MGAFVGLLLGVGLLLIWRSGPRAPQRHDSHAAARQHRTAAPGRRRRRRPGAAARRAGAVRAGRRRRRPADHVDGQRRAVLRRVRRSSCRSWSCAACAGAGWSRCASCGPRPSTTSRRPCAPECRCPKGFPRSGERGPAELRPAFARFGTAYRASGRFGECLDALKDDLADPVGDRVCETVRVAREVGGSDLGTVLRTLSELLRSDARTRAELETRQGWIVNAARLAVAAPWLVLLLLGTQSADAAGRTTRRAARCCSASAPRSAWSPTGSCCASARLPEDRRVLQ